jgi:Lrp/AsnC family transcriptional regulator, regulator for asnA, asnC and gidA
MDGTNRKLIQLLQDDGRQSNKALAAHLGISHATVQRRIKHLVNDGVIQFSTLINPNVFGSPLGVIVALTVTQRELKTVMQTLANHRNSSIVAHTTGRFNVMALSLFSNFDDLCDFILNVLTRMAGVKSSDIFPLLHLYQLKDTPINLSVDSLDRKLIEMLSQDGRQSSVALSNSLKVSPTTIQRRLHNLIEQGVIRIFAAVDDTKVDWYWPAVLGIRIEREHIFDVLATLKTKPRVRFVSCTAGRYSIIALIDAPTRMDLHEFVEEEVSRIEGVRDCELATSRGVIYCPAKIGDAAVPAA